MSRLALAALAVTVSTALTTAGDVTYPKSQYDNGYYGNASPGDFVLFVDEAEGYPSSQVQVYRIDTPNRAVTVSTTKWPKPVGSGKFVTTERRVFDGADPAGGGGNLVATSRADTIRVMNQEWKCTLWEYTYKDGPKKGQVYERAWFSPKAPFDGCVKAQTPTGTYVISEYLYAKAPR